LLSVFASARREQAVQESITAMYGRGLDDLREQRYVTTMKVLMRQL